jgi:hypothetical protein
MSYYKENPPSQSLEVSISGLKDMYDMDNIQFSNWVGEVVGDTSDTNDYIPHSYPFGFTNKEIRWIKRMWKSVSTNKGIKSGIIGKVSNDRHFDKPSL